MPWRRECGGKKPDAVLTFGLSAFFRFLYPVVFGQPSFCNSWEYPPNACLFLGLAFRQKYSLWELFIATLAPSSTLSLYPRHLQCDFIALSLKLCRFPFPLTWGYNQKAVGVMVSSSRRGLMEALCFCSPTCGQIFHKYTSWANLLEEKTWKRALLSQPGSS